MDDADILQRVHGLIDEEHALRSRLEAGEVAADEERRRLGAIEESLDQCWDLLRQRRARRDAGEEPSAAHVRDKDEVEGYLQ